MARGPVFTTVVDLGLRDIGVRNDPRRLAALGGRMLAFATVLAFVLATAACVLAVQAGADRLVVAVFFGVSVLGIGIVLARMTGRVAPVVVRVTAERNHALTLLAAPALLCAAALVALAGWAAVPVALLSLGLVAVAVRHRSDVPALLGAAREQLASGEAVQGDGVGLLAGGRGRDALRLVLVTDRRLLITAPAGVLVDAAFEDIRRFAIAWRVKGRFGTLTIDAGETHQVTQIAPANLVAIATALREHGVTTDDPDAVTEAARSWEAALHRSAPRIGRRRRIAGLAVLAVLLAAGFVVRFDPLVLKLAFDQMTGDTRPVDGRTDLTEGAASFTYTPGGGLHELVTDEAWTPGDPADGARWELRSGFRSGQNVVSLASYHFDREAMRTFVADKDAEHAMIAGHPVRHTEVTVDGRRGYVWEHGNAKGYWHRAVWFPDERYSVRVECIAKDERERFKALCDEALGSLHFG